jgi:hypothetical protein
MEREFVELWLSKKVQAAERQQAAILGWARKHPAPSNAPPFPPMIQSFFASMRQNVRGSQTTHQRRIERYCWKSLTLGSPAPDRKKEKRKAQSKRTSRDSSNASFADRRQRA